MNLNLAIRKSCGADGVSLGKGERALRPLLSGRLVNRLAAPAQRLNGRTGLACAFDLAAADRRSAQVLNRAKIEATISNAGIVAGMIETQPGSFEQLLWSFAPDRARRARPTSFGDVPAVTPESTAMSKALRSLGFRFVGPTTMYALMQSTGMVDDHLRGCWRAL